jgi:hypothetical protein
MIVLVLFQALLHGPPRALTSTVGGQARLEVSGVDSLRLTRREAEREQQVGLLMFFRACSTTIDLLIDDYKCVFVVVPNGLRYRKNNHEEEMGGYEPG